MHITFEDGARRHQDLAQALGGSGYEVQGIDSGEKALDHLKTEECDLVIVDMVAFTGTIPSKPGRSR